MDPFEAKLLRLCGGKDSIRSTKEPPYRQLEARALALALGDTLPPNVPAGDTTDFSLGFTGVLGPYTLQDVLGRGGMGIVYRAEHRTLRRPVALKTLYGGVEPRLGSLLRFQVEGEAIARLDHPNIVKVYDFGESGDQQYLAMELIDGETLSKKLASGPLECDHAVRLVHALAGAVGYAHDQGVIHRDLKPSNVLITRDGVPKIVDFGLARILRDAPRLTATDAVMGTPNYMAPEQADGRVNDINEQTDVYALGVILYETITGGPLFAGDNKLDILRLVRVGNIISPRQLCSNVSLDLEAICLKCLERSQRDRYRSAHELRQELECVINGTPVIAKRPTRWQLLGRRVRRRAPVALAVLLVAGCLIGAVAAWMPKLVVSTVPNGESESVRRELEAELDKGRPATLVGETGYPKWFRWRAGKDSQRTHIEPDGTFSAEMIRPHVTGVLELLPDPRTDRYKLTAQIRHDVGGSGGFVGFYVGHRSYPREPTDIQIFHEIRFNAVTASAVAGLTPPRDPLGAKGLIVMPKAGATIPMALMTQLMTDTIDSSAMGAHLNIEPGARLTALGPRNGVWFDVEMTVTPDEIVAQLAGSVMRLTRQQLTADGFTLGRNLTYLRVNHPDDAVLHNLRPEFAPRGGAGLTLYPNAAASVRRVTVTPLPVDR